MPTATLPRGTVDPEAQRRVLGLLRDAGERGTTKAKLAEAMGLSERQITRAFQALLDAGAEIERISRGGVRFVLRKGPDWDRPIPPEARIALDVALQLVECAGAELWTRPLLALRELVDGSLGQREQAKLGTLQAHVSAHGTVSDAVPVERAILATLLQALSQEPPEELELDYRDMHGKASTRRVAPHSLSHDAFSGAIHLLGWDGLRDRPQHYRLNRIEGARPTGRRALHPHRDALERIRTYRIAGWIGEGEPFEVTVRVTGGWAQHLREACPDLPEAWVEEAGPDTVRLHFKALEHRGPLRVLLQFGKDAEVLEPPALREAMRVEVAALARRYGA